MNLTLLPTDLKSTEKTQSTLDNPVAGDHSSQFGQLLNAETSSMQKSTAQAEKNVLKGEKPADDKTAGSEWLQSKPVSGTTTTGNTSQTDAPQQEEGAEFAVLKEDELLSAEALSAVIPIQIAELVNPSSTSSNLAENTDELQAGANGKLHALLGKDIKNARLANSGIAEPPEENDQDGNIRLDLLKDSTLNNNTNIHPTLTPVAGKTKLAADNKTASDNTIPKNMALNSGKDLNLLQMAVQGTSALTATAMETPTTDSPLILANSPLLSAGQQSAGQFQLNSTTTPLLSAHLGSEEWQQQLNQHVLFFNRNGLQQAELRLHPQELGALHIRMSVEDNQAHMHFVSAHQNVRAALEAALPGLRHALAESGIQLAQSSVNSDSQGNWQQDHHAGNPTNHNPGSRAETQGHDSTTTTEMMASHAPTIRVTPQQLASTRGGVDTFA
ncbi:flagellar hook-length control protein FliK [Xenorhabdus szentirmaii]|uniref:flagellar hook-length control protein FliK n=1 Tax=Xenorhabdus szentirmaii TaxID=290112 RepID=UPI000C0415CD|nr:flagellar hook-length control protein FliK [Xenorhabdus szentirmaii]PHM41678.1 flagellar hook-length control protein FliK [Xenorhabdus szentirmaii]